MHLHFFLNNLQNVFGKMFLLFLLYMFTKFSIILQTPNSCFHMFKRRTPTKRMDEVSQIMRVNVCDQEHERQKNLSKNIPNYKNSQERIKSASAERRLRARADGPTESCAWGMNNTEN